MTMAYCNYSGTSDNGHSEEWTTSLQWTHCSPPAYILSIPQKKGQSLNNGQNACTQLVHYSEVPLYTERVNALYTERVNASMGIFFLLAAVVSL